MGATLFLPFQMAEMLQIPRVRMIFGSQGSEFDNTGGLCMHYALGFASLCVDGVLPRLESVHSVSVAKMKRGRDVEDSVCYMLINKLNPIAVPVVEIPLQNARDAFLRFYQRCVPYKWKEVCICAPKGTSKIDRSRTGWKCVGFQSASRSPKRTTGTWIAEEN